MELVKYQNRKYITKIQFYVPLINPLRANPAKWSETLKQFVDKLPTNCLSVFDHFVGLALKGLKPHCTYIKKNRYISD